MVRESLQNPVDLAYDGVSRPILARAIRGIRRWRRPFHRRLPVSQWTWLKATLHATSNRVRWPWQHTIVRKQCGKLSAKAVVPGVMTQIAKQINED
jgi:hypothetical protein